MGSNTRQKTFFIGIFLLMAIHPSRAQTPDRSFDTVIINGHIVDGTGSPWYSGDIGIRGAKIAAIGNLSAAQRTRTIDAHGMVVADHGGGERRVDIDPGLGLGGFMLRRLLLLFFAAFLGRAGGTRGQGQQKQGGDPFAGGGGAAHGPCYAPDW